MEYEKVSDVTIGGNYYFDERGFVYSSVKDTNGNDFDLNSEEYIIVPNSVTLKFENDKGKMVEMKCKPMSFDEIGIKTR